MESLSLLKKNILIITLYSINYWVGNRIRLILLIFISSVSLLSIMTGCSSSPPPDVKTPPYKLIFNTAGNVNNSAPLKIHIILLTSQEDFMSADFFALQSKAKETLGDKLVSEDQFFILPNKNKYSFLEKNQPEASYIGVIAEYSQLNNKKWRIVFPTPALEHIPFYKFWRSKPDALQTCIKVTGNGLTPDLNCVAGTE